MRLLCNDRKKIVFTFNAKIRIEANDEASANRNTLEAPSRLPPSLLKEKTCPSVWY